MIRIRSRAALRVSRRAVAALTAAAAVAIVLTGCSTSAEVVRVIDGDTIVVTDGSRTEKVRLLNIDTPELRGVDGNPECLALEAKAFTEQLLPVGSSVKLTGDEEVRDRYGRILARVETHDGVNVSAALARHGLGFAREYGDNIRDYKAVLDASRKAEVARVGLFAPEVACSPEALARAVEAQAAGGVPTDSAGISHVIAATAAALEAADLADASLRAMSWLSPGQREAYATRIRDAKSVVAGRNSAGEAALGPALAMEEAERQAAEAARIAAEAEASRQVEAAAREAAAQEADAEQGSSSGGSSSDGSSGGGYPSDAGYTGCRNYNGYGMIDSKGRHFEPIPCP